MRAERKLFTKLREPRERLKLFYLLLDLLHREKIWSGLLGGVADGSHSMRCDYALELGHVHRRGASCRCDGPTMCHQEAETSNKLYPRKNVDKLLVLINHTKTNGKAV